jgi:hypothetical protein
MTTPNKALRKAYSTDIRACVARILAVWHAADDAERVAGAAWYLEAGEHASTLAERHGTTREHAAAVLAHLSPRTFWARNVAAAYSLYADGTAAHCITRNVENARVAMGSTHPLATFSPAAKKTRAFAANILGDEHRVTVDVWAVRIALGNHTKRNNPISDAPLGRVGVYEAIERAYQVAAERAGVAPAVMQATTWVVVRGRVA